MAGLRDLEIQGRRVIPARLLSVRFARSGGPGGQNVNKVESKVDLRLDLDGCIELLGEHVVVRIRDRLATRLDAEQKLCVVCNEHRSQARNLATALDRMEKLLRRGAAAHRHRRATRPTRASRERRLGEKRRRGDIKRGRGDRGED